MNSSDNARYADNQQVSKKTRISDEYFAGFVDGEGCFYVGFSRRDDLPLKWQVITEFHVSQNLKGIKVLESFRDRLRCGYIKPNHPKSFRDRSWVLVIKERKDLIDKVVPFFNKHPLHSGKQADFQAFAKVLDIIKQGEHLRREGFDRIVELVFKRGNARYKKYSKEVLLSS
jgi:hypothetical protein